jgi:hypothetical protein
VAALRAVDSAWDAGNLDLSEMEAYLARLLEAQLKMKTEIKIQKILEKTLHSAG